MPVVPLVLFALLGALFAGAWRSRSAWVPNVAAEQAACTRVVRERPQVWAGRRRGASGEVAWLADVAFFQAYGAWPVRADQQQLDRLAAILACISQSLALGRPLG